MMDNLIAKTKLGEHFTFNISYLLISLMMGCVAISFIQLVNRIFPDWSGGYVVILVALISLERIFTIIKIDSLEREKKIIYHIAEWVTFAVGLKIIQYVPNGFDSFLYDLQAWQTNFGVFFSGEFIPILILLAFAWWVSGSFATDMEELRVESMDLHWEAGILENRRQDAREAIINRILWLGILMIFASVLTRLDIAALFGPYLSYQAPVINTLFYFLCALLLFSQTQFSLLRGRWIWHQTSPPPTLGQSWLKYGAGFLFLITLLAFLLPTNYTFGFLDVLRYIITFVIQIVIIIISLLSLPFGWLLSLLSGSNLIEEPPQTSEFTNIFTQNSKTEVDPTLQLIQTILFWAFLLGMISFSVIYFLRQNTTSFPNVNIHFGKNWFTNLLSVMWSWLRGGYLGISEAVSSVRNRLARKSSISLQHIVKHFPNFRHLSPRQRIIFFYTRLIDRANEAGIQRKPSQTPLQFSAMFEEKIPDITQEIKGLTQAFEEARYSRHEILTESSNQVQKFWNRISRSLQNQKK